MEEITIEYPIGHRRRREEGIPVLLKKYRRNLGKHFPAQQANDIYALCEDHQKLDALSVDQFVDMMVI